PTLSVDPMSAPAPITPTAQQVLDAITTALTPTGSSSLETAAPAPNTGILGGYGFHLTHLVSEFTLLAGMLGGIYLEAAQAAALGSFAGLVQLATAVAGLVGMTYGHVSFNATMAGVSVSK
ncbi:MAG: hypothetical protein ACREB9_09095, partial [Thermoplasmata archaeon]